MRKLALWGHHVDECQEMFDLSMNEMHGCILEYGCGPTAVNAQLTEMDLQEGHIVSCDPLFTLDRDTLYSKTMLVFADMAAKLTKEKKKFDFSRYGSLKLLIEERREGIDRFFADYHKGKVEQRYVGVSDYTLPFADFHFDFALSSHYLFADLDDQDRDLHLAVIKELARVAKEVRIFPLIDRDGHSSLFLGPVLLGLQQANYGVEVRKVNYSLQPTGNAMLRVWAQQCSI